MIEKIKQKIIDIFFTKREYYVTYTFAKSDNTGFGSMYVQIRGRFILSRLTHSDIYDIQKYINEKEKYDSVIIQNMIRIKPNKENYFDN